jgi:hypothetical protein
VYTQLGAGVRYLDLRVAEMTEEGQKAFAVADAVHPSIHYTLDNHQLQGAPHKGGRPAHKKAPLRSSLQRGRQRWKAAGRVPGDKTGGEMASHAF